MQLKSSTFKISIRCIFLKTNQDNSKGMGLGRKALGVIRQQETAMVIMGKEKA